LFERYLSLITNFFMDPVYLAELRLFAGNFAPAGFALCAGQLLPIAQYTALFALLGTTYGGNGQTNFQLPNLQGRITVGAGQGNGLSVYNLGQQGGTEAVTLTTGNIPAHTHLISNTTSQPATAAAGNTDTPYNTYPASVTGTNMYSPTSDGSTMAIQQQPGFTVGSSGSATPQPVSLMQPVLGLVWIIATSGVFPSRS
jgi:microcystin-dependent protein